MERSFNTTGPCFPDEHYMLPPERRLGEVLDLIARNKYFVLHAGRQTGKTTSLLWLEQHLPRQGKRALWLDVQTARDQPDPARAFRTMFDRLASALESPHEGLKAAEPAQVAAWFENPATAVLHYTQFLTSLDPRPLVLLIDEVDSLVGETMISFLTQIRAGYIGRRQTQFPSSVVMVGTRSADDFIRAEDQQLNTAGLNLLAPFNISPESTKLGAFSEADVAELLGQHTEATGQRFEAEAIARIRELGEGHPWVTSALSDQIVRKDVLDHSTAITRAHVEAAMETIIVEHRPHLDSLSAQLRKPRIGRKFAPVHIVGC